MLLWPGLALAQQPMPAPQPAQAPPGARMRVPGHEAPQAGGFERRAPGPMRPDLGAWWKNSEIVQELGLNQQQISQIESTFLDHRLELIDLKAAVEREEVRLQPLMEADQVDEAKVSAQVDRVLGARTSLEKANVMMMISIRKVLTVEQWKKLESIKHRREGMFHRRVGPGEFPAPPPPPDEPDAVFLVP
jgi:Spy/CpxP family protein refolding chaperone